MTSPYPMIESTPEQDTGAGSILPAAIAVVEHNSASPQEPAQIDQVPTSNETRGRTDLVDPILVLLADVLDDAERTRIANENRLRQLTRDVEDSDGEMRGFGLPLTEPSVAARGGR